MVLITTIYGKTRNKDTAHSIYSNKLTGRCRCKIFENFLVSMKK